MLNPIIPGSSTKVLDDLELKIQMSEKKNDNLKQEVKILREKDYSIELDIENYEKKVQDADEFALEELDKNEDLKYQPFRY